MSQVIPLGWVLAAGVAGMGFAVAGEAPPPPEEAKSFCEMYEGFADRFTVFESDSGFLRSLAFTGRYQVQFFHNSQHVSGAAGPLPAFDDNDTDCFVRRFRFGWKAGFLDRFTWLAEFNLDPSWDDEDVRFGEMGVGNPGVNGRRRGEVGFVQSLFQTRFIWRPSDRLTFVAGKFEPDVTLEDGMLSFQLNVIEVSSLTEMMNHDSTAGARVELANVWGNDLLFGVFNGGSEDDHRTFPGGRLQAQISDLPQTNGDWGCQVKLNRNLLPAGENRGASSGQLKRARAGLWWFHADDTHERDTAGLDTNFEEFTDIWSLNAELETDRWGVLADSVFGNVDSAKDNDTDVWGLVLTPHYNLSRKWQLVYRHARMWGVRDREDDLEGRGAGVDLDPRLRTGGGMVEGDRLSSNYLGANYYLCGHKLKLQFGLEHIDIEDRSSLAACRSAEYWSYQSAFKMYF